MERITDVVYERLRLLMAFTSDYFVASQVVRFNQKEGYSPLDRQIALAQASNVRLPEMDHAGNPPATAWQVTFSIHCHVKPSELDQTPSDELVNVMACEVMKAITNNQATWHTMDSLAINADFGDWEPIEDDGSGLDGVNIPLQVIYRTSENDPYTVRA